MTVSTKISNIPQGYTPEKKLDKITISKGKTENMISVSCHQQIRKRVPATTSAIRRLRRLINKKCEQQYWQSVINKSKKFREVACHVKYPDEFLILPISRRQFQFSILTSQSFSNTSNIFKICVSMYDDIKQLAEEKTVPRKTTVPYPRKISYTFPTHVKVSKKDNKKTRTT